MRLDEQTRPADVPRALRACRVPERPHVVRLFDEDPDLLGQLEPAQAAAARRRVVAPVCPLVRGAWRPELEWLVDGAIGLLVLDGVVVRHVEIGGRRAAELVGPGDFISPRHEGLLSHGTLPARMSWLVVEPGRAAVIDAEVHAAIRGLPGVTDELLGRAVKRAAAVTSLHASVRLPQLDTRLLWILWQLADRWGRRSPDGVSLTVPLTHELLSDLACANRPAVSRALGRLAAAGLAWKQNGCWKLHGSPPLDDLPVPSAPSLTRS